jgi:hypothetical protein
MLSLGMKAGMGKSCIDRQYPNFTDRIPYFQEKMKSRKYPEKSGENRIKIG